MMWRSVFWSLSFLSHLVFCSAQLSCSELQYTPTSCLEIIRPAMSASDANLDCTSNNLNGLAPVEQDIEFEALKRFAEVLLEDSELLWLGYLYDVSGVLRLRDGNAVSESAALLDEQNFALGGQPAGSGVCVAIGKDGLFRRTFCSEPYVYACYQDMAPRVTSFSVSSSRFLMAGSSATLTCQFYPPGASVMWRFNYTTVDSASVSTSQTESSLTVDPFTSAASGQYECIVSNDVGGVVSEGITLIETVAEMDGGTGMDAPVPTVTSIDTSPSVNNIRTSTMVTLTCNSNDTSAIYQWYFNGVRIDSVVQMDYTIASFSQGGFYQCRAALATGENSVYTIRLDALDPPGPDESISASPLTRDSILVLWASPVFSRDPLLLRYSLFYTTSDTPLNIADYSQAQSVPNLLLPTLRDSSVTQGGRVVEYELPNLQPGTEYMISVRASFMGLDAANSFYVAQTFTYGHAPAEMVQGLMLSRTFDNKSLLAMWDKLESQPPVGQIVIYEIEFRNQGKDITIMTRVSSLYDYFSILELEDANAYEVRVRAGVQVSSDPVEYDFNEFTAWKVATAVVTEVPSPPPTSGVRPPLSGGEIAAIVVCVCVAFLVVLILTAGLIALLVRSRTSKGHEFSRARTDSSSGMPLSKTKADEAKEGSPETVI